MPSLHNLAFFLKKAGRFEEAEPMMRRALAIAEQGYGPDHFRVAACLGILGMLLRATGCWEEAERLVRRALAIDERTYGPHHPDVAKSLNNLAMLLADMGRLPEAQRLVGRARRIVTTSLSGEDQLAKAVRDNARQLKRAMSTGQRRPPKRRGR